MTDLSALIAQLEAAKEGSRELDYAIHEALFPTHNRVPPGYTTDSEAAAALAPPDARICFASPVYGGPEATHEAIIAYRKGEMLMHSRDYRGENVSLPLAICAAALKAWQGGRDATY